MAGAGLDLDPYQELEGLADDFVRRAPWLPPAQAVAEMARRLAGRPGWTVVDDPDPSSARPSFVAYRGQDPPVLCSRSWLRLLVVEARARIGY